VLAIDELDKPEGVLCRHCESGRGCGIYPDRPVSCRGFYCGYLALPFVAQHWFPDDCGMVVFPLSADKRLAVHVDPANPDAWRAEPFHSDLRKWAVAAEQMGFQVNVSIGRRSSRSCRTRSRPRRLRRRRQPGLRPARRRRPLGAARAQGQHGRLTAAPAPDCPLLSSRVQRRGGGGVLK
jgi:hypothetical protein